MPSVGTMHSPQPRRAPGRAGEAQAEPLTKTARATVLIVDDDVVVAETLSEDLTEASYETLVAGSGERALELLGAREVDLVLLDLRLPGMSGLEVLERIAARDGTRYLPVIVLSALEHDATDALIAGASDYVKKPWQREELLARVRVHLRLRQREAQLAAAVVRLDERTRQLEDEMTERKRAEAQLVMANRMSAVGVVAAGVAHEINNPLTYVAGNLELVARRLRALDDALVPGVSELRTFVSQALEGAERVRVIVHDLRTFSRPDSEAVEPVDLAEVLDSVLRIAGHELRHRARVVREYGELPKVAGNVPRISQVLLNVVTNAAQAMASAHPDRDSLRVRMRALERSPFVEVEIEDTGAGMDQATLARAFEPFFTTKPGGAGTGLGLALTKKIIEGFGGSIELESAPDRGTLVRIRLRRYAGPELGTAAPERPTRAAERRPRVLVVDDEESIGTTIRAMLEADYEVDLATSAREALAKLPGHPPYDLVLCDLMMDGMNGIDLFERARDHPGLAERFVFMTGGACTDRARAFVSAHEESVIDKPFTADELQRKLDARHAH